MVGEREVSPIRSHPGPLATVPPFAPQGPLGAVPLLHGSYCGTPTSDRPQARRGFKAKLGASRLTGKDAPLHADTEATMAELHARVRAVIAYLDGFSQKDYAASAARVITQPRWEGKVMSGEDYFQEHAVPNFYFHLTHAYAILRANGVSIGKRDYLGALSQKLP